MWLVCLYVYLCCVYLFLLVCSGKFFLDGIYGFYIKCVVSDVLVSIYKEKLGDFRVYYGYFV